MTAIDLFFSQVPNMMPQTKNRPTEEKESDVFNNILKTQKTSTEIPVLEVESTEQAMSLTNTLVALTGILPNELLNENRKLMNDDEVFIHDQFKDLVPEGIQRQISLITGGEMEGFSLWDALTLKFEQLGMSKDDILKFISIEQSGHSKTDKLDEQAIDQQFTNLLVQANLLLSGIQNDRDVERLAPRLLNLIEKWVSLEQAVAKDGLRIQAQLSETRITSEEHSIWKVLINTYQKRIQLVKDQKYHSDASVTSKDISKWLSTALQTIDSRETNHTMQSGPISSMPMSELEQYIIHINQSKGTHSSGQQLLKQFQQVLKTSRFLSGNGVNQLSIVLRPNNMGELVVRLTEVNGEMTVKIIASSSITRQMLESNIHELRHMFSPQQVVIEEQDLDTQDVQKELGDETFKDKEENHPNHSNEDKERDSKTDFETKFLDLLMNEKV